MTEPEGYGFQPEIPAAPGADRSGTADEETVARSQIVAALMEAGLTPWTASELSVYLLPVVEALAARRPHTDAEAAVERVLEICDRVQRAYAVDSDRLVHIDRIRRALADDAADGGDRG